MKQRFIGLLMATGRPGIDRLLGWLDNETDFFRAPASTQHHGAHEGGLLEHSLAVHDNLQKVNVAFNILEDHHSQNCQSVLATVALLHDICKANFYTVSSRNVKNEETGKWEKVPYYAIDDQIPLGHGEKSVILIQRFIRPTLEEIMAIRWHMGGWEDSARAWGGAAAQSTAMKKCRLITALHMADLAASYFDGK